MQGILFESPSPPRGSGANVLFESPSPCRGSGAKVLFESLPDSHVECGEEVLFESPVKKMRGLGSNSTPIVSCFALVQPRAPTKKSRFRQSLFEDDDTPVTPKGINDAFSGFLPGSPLPKEYNGLLGTGSYASVYSANLRDGTPVAVKSQPIDDRFPLCDANATVVTTSGAGECVPGCITAFYDCQNEENGDVTVRTIMPVATPLKEVSNKDLIRLLPYIKDVTRDCPPGVLMDLSLENMGLRRKGDPTICINRDGVLVGGLPLDEDCVCAIDLGCSSDPDPSVANNNYAALNASCETPADIMKIREFKWELILAQIMNPDKPILELRDMISVKVFGKRT